MDRILVVAAHPDDEVLGCGGFVARRAAEGHHVAVAILGQGAASRHADGAEASAEIALLDRQAAEAAALLGAASFHRSHLPDNRFDSLALLEVVRLVEGLLEAEEPDVILTHHAGDLNIDHAVTARAVLTAARPLPNGGVRTILAFETPSCTEWAFGLPPAFAPNVFVDIAGFLDRKLAAMALYSGETRDFPHPRSAQALRHLAACRGSAAGLDAAEAFQLIRQVQR